MNKLKLIILVLALIGFAACDSAQPQDNSELVFSEEGCDFRMLKWGMSEEEVEQAETQTAKGVVPYEGLPYKGVAYNIVKIFDRNAVLVHGFKDGLYVRGDYLFKNVNVYNYQALRNRLGSAYGQPDESKNLGNLTFATWHFENKIMSLSYRPFEDEGNYSIKLTFLDPAHLELADEYLLAANWLANFPDNNFRMTPEADFRNIKWGASLEQVTAAEGRPPLRITEDQGLGIVKCDFGFAEWYRKQALVRYEFKDNQCFGANVYFHQSSWDDYYTIRAGLYHILGKPDVDIYGMYAWFPNNYVITIMYSPEVSTSEPNIILEFFSDQYINNLFGID